MPKISVIIPAFNCERSLPETIRSVLKQDYADFEILVSDDGSTDGTGRVCRSFTDPRIRYLRGDNRGPSAARNRAIRASEGEYIALLDSDDKYLPGKLRAQVEYLDRHEEAGIVYTDGFVTYPHKESIVYGKDDTRPHRGYVFDQLFMEYFMLTSSVMIRRKCFDTAGLFNESLYRSEDYELFLRIAKDYPVGYIDRALMEYSKNRQDRLTGDFRKLCEADHKMLLGIIDRYPDYFSARKELARKRLRKLCFEFGYRCFKLNSHGEARRMFLKSIGYDKRFLTAYLYTGFTFLNPGTVSFFRNFKKRFRNVRFLRYG